LGEASGRPCIEEYLTASQMLLPKSMVIYLEGSRC